MRPSEYIYNAPATSDILKRLKGRAIVYSSDFESILRSIESFPKKIIGIEYFGKIEDISDKNKIKGKHISIKISETSDLVNFNHKLPRQLIIIRVDSNESLTDKVKFISSLNFVPDILPNIPHLGEDECKRILDHYLYYRALMVPIEPFHTLLLSMTKSFNFNLWEATHTNPDRFFFITEKGEIALNRNEAVKGKILGTVDDNLEQWKNSAPYLEHLKFFTTIHLQNQPCAECRFFFICGGFSYYQNKSCVPWLTIFKSLRTAAMELNDLKIRMPMTAPLVPEIQK